MRLLKQMFYGQISLHVLEDEMLIKTPKSKNLQKVYMTL